MRKFAIKLFHSMGQDIQICKNKGFDEEKEIECCFQVCSKYWNEVRIVLSNYEFKTDTEEIDFFKNIKPLFTSEIEYYNLLYHAQLFKPPFDEEELQKFWQREFIRMERFIENHQAFYQYILNNDTSLDAIYYLRQNLDGSVVVNAGVDEIHNKTSTTQDALLAQYFALKRYSVYVQNQIENINKRVKNGNT